MRTRDPEQVKQLILAVLTVVLLALLAPYFISDWDADDAVAPAASQRRAPENPAVRSIGKERKTGTKPQQPAASDHLQELEELLK